MEWLTQKLIKWRYSSSYSEFQVSAVWQRKCANLSSHELPWFVGPFSGTWLVKQNNGDISGINHWKKIEASHVETDDSGAVSGDDMCHLFFPRILYNAVITACGRARVPWRNSNSSRTCFVTWSQKIFFQLKNVMNSHKTSWIGMFDIWKSRCLPFVFFGQWPIRKWIEP